MPSEGTDLDKADHADLICVYPCKQLMQAIALKIELCTILFGLFP